MDKFKKWLEQCPVEYDEIQETGDKDILTINFHGKDIYWHASGPPGSSCHRVQPP